MKVDGDGPWGDEGDAGGDHEGDSEEFGEDGNTGQVGGEDEGGWGRQAKAVWQGAVRGLRSLGSPRV